MLLSQLFLPGSCALLLMGCSGDAKSADRLALSPDTALASVIAESQVNAVAPLFQSGDLTPPQRSSSSGGNPPDRLEVQQQASTARLANDTSATRKAQQPTTTDVLASATASPNSRESLTAFTASESDSAEVDLQHDGRRFLNRKATLGIASATIGVGAFLNVGGFWGHSDSSQPSNDRTGPGGFGFGFDGYHQPHGGHASPWSGSNSGDNSNAGSNHDNPNTGGDNHDSPHNGDNDNPHTGGDDSHAGGDNGAPNNNGDGGYPHDEPNPPAPPQGGSSDQPPVTATPEPATVVLLATGFAAMIPVIRRRRRRQ